MPVLPGEDDAAGSTPTRPNVAGGVSKTPIRKTSSTESSTNYYSSLPRSMGHRTLPSLPETGTLSTPGPTVGTSSGQPLVRSVSYNPEQRLLLQQSQNSSMHNQSSSKSPLISDLIAAEHNDIKRPDKLDIWYVIF
jgi:hypothetical protein